MITAASQSFLDISIQLNGDVFSCLDLAKENQMNVTDDILAGTNIKEIDFIVMEREVRDFFVNNKRKVATAFASEPITNDYELPQGEFPISL